jgi:hypothetical protein
MHQQYLANGAVASCSNTLDSQQGSGSLKDPCQPGTSTAALPFAPSTATRPEARMQLGSQHSTSTWQPRAHARPEQPTGKATCLRAPRM